MTDRVPPSSQYTTWKWSNNGMLFTLKNKETTKKCQDSQNWDVIYTHTYTPPFRMLIMLKQPTMIPNEPILKHIPTTVPIHHLLTTNGIYGSFGMNFINHNYNFQSELLTEQTFVLWQHYMTWIDKTWTVCLQIQATHFMFQNYKGCISTELMDLKWI
jgi:hypothetical protein